MRRGRGANDSRQEPGRQDRVSGYRGLLESARGRVAHEEDAQVAREDARQLGARRDHGKCEALRVIGKDDAREGRVVRVATRHLHEDAGLRCTNRVSRSSVERGHRV